MAAEAPNVLLCFYRKVAVEKREMKYKQEKPPREPGGQKGGGRPSVPLSAAGSAEPPAGKEFTKFSSL